MAKKWSDQEIKYLLKLYPDYTLAQIASKLNKKYGTKHTENAVRKAHARYKYPVLSTPKTDKPRILIYDLETSPIIAYVWGLWDQNIGLSQILEQSTILSFSAKWYGEDEIIYEDVSKQKNLRDDKSVVKKLWKLIDSADAIVAHNGNSFDVKVMNARFIKNGLQPPSSYKRFDTLRMVKKNFKFMSNKLAHLTDSLCTTHKKSAHGKFAGFSMWEQCLKGNKEAWAEMKMYNEKDVTSLEELFTILLPWESSSLFEVYNNSDKPTCTCGSTEFKKSGFYYTNAAKYQKYRCKSCGSESRDGTNLIDKNLRKIKRKATNR